MSKDLFTGYRRGLLFVDNVQYFINIIRRIYEYLAHDGVILIKLIKQGQAKHVYSHDSREFITRGLSTANSRVTVVICDGDAICAILSRPISPALSGIPDRACIFRLSLD